LAALQAAGISKFVDLLDMERDDLLQVPGIGDEEATAVIAIIDELTVEEEVPESVETERLGDPAASAEPVVEEEEQEKGVTEIEVIDPTAAPEAAPEEEVASAASADRTTED
jgi:hypothetical protein